MLKSVRQRSADNLAPNCQMVSYLTSAQGISSTNGCQLKQIAHGIYQDGPITHTLDSWRIREHQSDYLGQWSARTLFSKQYHADRDDETIPCLRAESLHTRYFWNAPLKDFQVTANLQQDTEAWCPLFDDTLTVGGHCERTDTYLQPIEPQSSRKMSRSFFFDYLLSLLAPLIASLFSKIQMSAPRAKCVVVHNANAPPADLIISTKYLEIYANHNLTAALLISLSVLSILHLVYFIYAIWQPLQPVNLPWRTEFEAYGNPEDEGGLARSRTNWHGVADILQSRLPDQGVHRQSTIDVVTLKCNRPPRGISNQKK
jgi:hypothetical protein